jgi:hypothetical protein
MLGVQPHLDPLADQTARHRVGVPTHVDRAARIHLHLDAARRLEPARRQRTQLFHLLGLLLLAVRVELTEQIAEIRLVGFAAGEVAADAEHQLLIERALEPVVPLLDVAVLVAVPGLDRLPLQTIVLQQRPIALCELRTRRPRWDRGGEPVRPVNGRDAAQFCQCVLQSVGERLERLGKTDRAGLPVRVGQHKVVDQVIEWLTVDRDTQIRHVREVGGTQPTGRVELREEHFLRRTLSGPPRLDPPLERPQLPVGKTAGVFPLELPKQRQRFQSRVEGQPLGNAGPDIGEGVRVSAPGVRHPYLAGKPAKPAVLAGGLGIHPRPGCGDIRGCALRVQLT